MKSTLSESVAAQLRARKTVQKAIQSGTLERPSVCSRCGETGRILGHHDDYSKPLEVEWLCAFCHRQTFGTVNRPLIEWTDDPPRPTKIGFCREQQGFQPYDAVRCCQCGYSWHPLVSSPRVCPRCRSPYWDRPKKALAGQKEE